MTKDPIADLTTVDLDQLVRAHQDATYKCVHPGGSTLSVRHAIQETLRTYADLLARRIPPELVPTLPVQETDPGPHDVHMLECWLESSGWQLTTIRGPVPDNLRIWDYFARDNQGRRPTFTHLRIRRRPGTPKRWEEVILNCGPGFPTVSLDARLDMGLVTRVIAVFASTALLTKASPLPLLAPTPTL